jgi:peptide/nickel transport system permease protein
MKYLLRRIWFYFIAAWVSITINFFLPRLMPGDPATRMLGRITDRLRPEQIVALKQVYGISDEPLIYQYFTYIHNLFKGNLGISISHFPSPVSDVIGTAMGWTILLGGVAVVLSALIGNLLGIVAAWKRGGWIDSIFPPLLVFIGSFPYFWLAMISLFVLGFELNWFPLRHAFGNGTPGLSWNFIQDVAWHLILPAGSVVLISVGGWMLGMRNTMIGVLSEDYITMANAKGLSERKVMFDYAARNALLPTVTSFGISLGFIVSGALMTEIVFSYPGVGFLLYNAVVNLDYPLLQGLLLIITLVVLAANLIVDLLYVKLDPRVRVH